MILRARLNTSICLRCQMRLSGQLPHNGARLSSPAARPGGLRQLHLHATQRVARENHGTEWETAEAHHTEQPVTFRKISHRDIPLRRRNWHMSGAKAGMEPLRLRELNRSNLRERTEDVPVDSLGRPTEVIVLRDKRDGYDIRFVTQKEIRKEVEFPQPPNPMDMLAELNEERGLIGRDEVNQNIDTLRPPARILSWEEIREVENLLSEGFTASHLLDYIQDSEKQRMAEIKKQAKLSMETEIDEEGETAAPRATENDKSVTKRCHKKGGNFTMKQSAWMPGISEQGESFEESALRGYVSEAFTPKQRVVMHLMRSCWNIEAKELLSSIGEIELQLDSADLELLISPRLDNPPLKVISDSLIQTDEERIEAFRSRRSIRITATKEQAEEIAKAIRGAVENMHRIIIPLMPLKRLAAGSKIALKSPDKDEFSESVLAELTKLTNAEVAKVSEDELEIHSLDRSPGSGLSTLADVARRVLLSSSDAADRITVNHGLKLTESPAYVVEWPLREGMSWRNRLRRWGRWETPIEKADRDTSNIESGNEQGKELSSTPEPSMILDNEPQEQTKPGLAVEKAEGSEAGLKEQYQSDEHRLWNSDPTIFTSAIVGNILHEVLAEEILDHTKSVTLDNQDAAKTRKLFVPSTRNLSRLVESMNGSTTRTSSFVMRFLPSPWATQGEKSLKAFPILEMHFHKTRKGELALARLLAFTEGSSNDIMIPDRTLDLSFRQNTAFAYIPENLKFYPQITNFLKNTELDLTKGKILTPPELVVSIPEFMCNGVGKSFQNKPTLDVSYLFAGLQFRNHISLNFDGWRLRYTSINGGKAAGQRAEVSLHPVRKAGEEGEKGEQTEKLVNDFVTSAFVLVEALENPPPVQVRKLNVDPLERDPAIRHVRVPLVERVLMNKKLGKARLYKYFAKSIDLRSELDEVKEEGEEEENADDSSGKEKMEWFLGKKDQGI